MDVLDVAVHQSVSHYKLYFCPFPDIKFTTLKKLIDKSAIYLSSALNWLKVVKVRLTIWQCLCVGGWWLVKCVLCWIDRPTIFIEIIQRIGCMVEDEEGKVNLMLSIGSRGNYTNNVKILSNQRNRGNRYKKDENEKKKK